MKVGIDIVAISRFEKNVLNNTFLKKHFTNKEINYIKSSKNSVETLAGMFACKEAFLKAIEVGVLNGINLNEIEIIYKENGAPELNLSSKIINKFNIKNTSVSISHDLLANTATAICTVE